MAVLCGVLEPEEGDEEQECGDGGLFGEKRGRRCNDGSRQLSACTSTVVFSVTGTGTESYLWLKVWT
jgi:hypothetical protein